MKSLVLVYEVLGQTAPSANPSQRPWQEVSNDNFRENPELFSCNILFESDPCLLKH